MSKEHESLFVVGMVGIRDGQGSRIPERSGASSNGTPCFSRFESALSGSHSNRIDLAYRRPGTSHLSGSTRDPRCDRHLLVVRCGSLVGHRSGHTRRSDPCKARQDLLMETRFDQGQRLSAEVVASHWALCQGGSPVRIWSPAPRKTPCRQGVFFYSMPVAPYSLC